MVIDLGLSPPVLEQLRDFPLQAAQSIGLEGLLQRILRRKKQRTECWFLNGISKEVDIYFHIAFP